MDTAEILVALGLAAFFVFGCFAMIFLDDLRHSIWSIQANTRRIADNVAAPGEQVDHLIQEIRDEAELRRRDTQPEKATPAEPEVEDVSHYSEQSVDPQAARDALEQAWREFYRRYGGHGYPLHADNKKASPEVGDLIERHRALAFGAKFKGQSEHRLDKPLTEYKDQAEITAEVAARLEKKLAEWPEDHEVSLGDQYPYETKMSDMIADHEARRVADQPAAQLAHCSCIWDIVWEPQTMARVGDKIEGREGIVQYNRDCPVHGHNSPDNRREDQ